MRALLDALSENILIADGAVGTLLYSYGVDRCFEELNLSHPEEIINVHKQYIDAGADIIQTNTYGANYAKLSRYGLQDQVKEINEAAVRLAKKAAGQGTYILGTIGGIRAINQHISIEEVKRGFREQLYCLLLEGVDGILLETYYDFEELKTVLQIVKKETNLPVIAQVSMHETGVLQNGMDIKDALGELELLGADIVGINCRMGPFHMVKSLEGVPLPKSSFLSVYPNASLPNYEEGRFYYAAEPDYFGDISNELRLQGARIIGGCCGTTPAHIKAVKERLISREPIKEKKVKTQELIKLKDPHIQKNLLHRKVKEKKTLIVELDPPKHLDTGLFFQGAKALKEEGIDAITLADNPLASPRVSNDAMGTLVQQKFGLDPLVHITCRDRNLIGLQSHLMGLHTLGIHNILAITGDPAKIGDFPGAASVYDLSSIELIELIKQNNDGLSFSGKSLRQRTNFSVGAAFNPNFRHLDASAKRLEKKQHAGADYFISQPVFSCEHLVQIAEATSHLQAPLFIGIMPLISSRNAEFLHHEVPGIKVPDEARKLMKEAEGDPLQSRAVGMEIAKELVETAMELFNGLYIITPFMRYDMSIELIRHANLIEKEKREVPYDHNIV
ncbi:bifunctional homocysteine S-methyltransferase/methylenetetrahydrofolate reductase [Rossellomorea marisflavi]|uniref:Bifunctional homocysteine S-methyltransferase/methylenetetrahydrofolate reductase n=1 Tax=Rossellomorea marisflavi TaxID=189381 RepID=A0A5D4RQX9_9BACI|nr:bifunctional homocysteine S-methyltransferase/methylenetetrahydrofolate reductase [Rossellomorea marisflavi]TYS53733.1 bifunctional homocysteine S-methyltransferase/methylenetetrahydrofolate reductase [Rossellomorea marisflavi]